jgi:hypothetical protein
LDEKLKRASTEIKKRTGPIRKYLEAIRNLISFLIRLINIVFEEGRHAPIQVYISFI